VHSFLDGGRWDRFSVHPLLEVETKVDSGEDSEPRDSRPFENEREI